MIKKSLLSALVITLFFGIPVEGKERFFADEMGRTVKISYPPMRIISLAPSITEILFALGLDQEIAGVTDFCDHPEAASKKTRIGGFVNPSIEKIVSVQPDLIIAIRDGNRAETIDRLTELAFPVYVVDPKSLDGVITTLQNIGDIVGRQENSRKIVNEIKAKRDKTAILTRFLPRPKVFFQIGYLPMITVGKGSLADELIRLAGGRSISENESLNYPSYNIEIVVQKAPEIIIMSSMESNRDYPRLIKMWQNWKSIPAVKRNAIHIADSNIVDRPTHRIVEGLEAMVRIIHPEVFKKVRINSPTD